MILTIKDAARYLGISPRTVQRLITEGKFPPAVSETEFGQDYRGEVVRKLRCWKEADLDQFKVQLRTVGRPRGDENCQ